jgi:hypothetical protein
LESLENRLDYLTHRVNVLSKATNPSKDFERAFLRIENAKDGDELEEIVVDLNRPDLAGFEMILLFMHVRLKQNIMWMETLDETLSRLQTKNKTL